MWKYYGKGFVPRISEGIGSAGLFVGFVTIAGSALLGAAFPKFPDWVTWALAALVVVYGLLHGSWLENQRLQKELDEERNARPRIDCSIWEQAGLWLLKVTNSGSDAEFQCWIDVLRLNVGSTVPRYQGWWRRQQSATSEIRCAGDDWVIIGSRQVDSLPGLIRWSLWGVGGTAGGGPIYEYNHFSASGGNAAPNAELRVTVSGKPQMFGGPWVRQYRFDINGLHETTPPTAHIALRPSSGSA